MDTAQKRTFEKWAGGCYAIGFVLSVLFGYYTHTGYFNHSDETPTPVLLAGIHAFMFGHAYLVWKGNTWAKGVMAMFLVVVLVVWVTVAMRQGLAGEMPFSIAHNLFRWGLCLVEVILLALSFRPTMERARAT